MANSKWPCGRSWTLTDRVPARCLCYWTTQGWRGVKELHPHLTGLEAVAFAIKLTPHWSGQRDVRPDLGVGNAELYCLSYDRTKPKRTNTYRV
jgi:hypothetical protein